MELNINYLKYFYDTLMSGSVNKAAQLNHVSQPAISQGIRKLEQQLGLSLLLHKKNRITPTQDGVYIFGHSKSVFSSINELKSKVQDLKHDTSGLIRMGCSNSLAKAILFPKVKAFERKYPKVEISIKVGKTSDQIRWLELDEIDIGLTIDNKNLDQFLSTSIHQGHFLLVGKKNCRNRFLVTESRPEVIKLKEALCKKLAKPNIMEVESWDLLYEMARNQLGYAFVPELVIKPHDKLETLNEKFRIPQIKYKVVTFTKNEYFLNKATQLFIKGLAA